MGHWQQQVGADDGLRIARHLGAAPGHREVERQQTRKHHPVDRVDAEQPLAHEPRRPALDPEILAVDVEHDEAREDEEELDPGIPHVEDVARAGAVQQLVGQDEDIGVKQHDHDGRSRASDLETVKHIAFPSVVQTEA